MSRLPFFLSHILAPSAGASIDTSLWLFLFSQIYAFKVVSVDMHIYDLLLFFPRCFPLIVSPLRALSESNKKCPTRSLPSELKVKHWGGMTDGPEHVTRAMGEDTRVQLSSERQSHPAGLGLTHTEWNGEEHKTNSFFKLKKIYTLDSVIRFWNIS